MEENNFSKKSKTGAVIGFIVGFAVAFAVVFYGFHTCSNKENNVTISDEKIEEAATMVNKNCPMDVDANTTMTSCEFKNGEFVYEYSVKGANVGNVDFSVVRSSIIESVKANGSSKTLFNALGGRGYSVKYIYRDDKNEEKSIVFSPSELTQNFGN